MWAAHRQGVLCHGLLSSLMCGFMVQCVTSWSVCGCVAVCVSIRVCTMCAPPHVSFIEIPKEGNGVGKLRHFFFFFFLQCVGSLGWWWSALLPPATHLRVER